MKRMARSTAAACLVVATGCRGAEKRIVHDLVLVAPAADVEFPWEHLAFGTLAAEPFQETGFERTPLQPYSDGYADVGLKARVLFRWPEPSPRFAVLDVAPNRGARHTSVVARLNGSPVARFVLDQGRRRYGFALPAEVQRPGGNRLRLEFAPPDGPPGESAGGARPARLYSLSIGRADDADLEWLGRDGAPPALGIGQGPKSRAVLQAGPSAVRLAFQAPGRAELRFTPDLHARAHAAGASATFTVAVGQAGGPEREIWRQRVASGGALPGEVALDLPAPAGEAASVVLRVTPDGDRRPAWGLWQGLRVMGDADGPATEDGRETGDPAPGVLLIILDAAAARHFGCYGYARPTTPEIDRIAAEGVVYERAYSPAVFTRSVMASIWTSQHPDQHRVGVDEGRGVSTARPTLAELLKEGNVHSAGFIGNRVASGFGLERGFAEFHSLYPKEGKGVQVGRAEAFRKPLLDYFERRPAERLFTYVHYLEPHFPYDPPAPFNTLFGPDAPLTLADRRQLHWLTGVNDRRITPTPEQVDHLRRLYDGSLAYVDREVGFLRRTLEQGGLWDQLFVIISSDHGEGLYEHGWIGHMKRVNDEAARVPLILRHPKGKGPAGSRVKEIVSLLDLAPTIADALGVAVPAGAFRGQSLLRGAPGVPAVTRNTDKEPTYAVTEGRHRLILQTADGVQELFDAVADPGEMRDLAAAQPIWAAAHRQALQWFLMNLGPETPSRVGPLSPSELEALRALGYLH